jgi:hypothetical protein
MAKYKKVQALEMHTRKSRKLKWGDQWGNLSLGGTTVL